MATLMHFRAGSTYLYFESGAQYPAARPIELYQVVDRTSAGTVQVENLGIKTKSRALKFELMSKTDHDNLLDWFENICIGSTNIFEFTDERGYVGDVRCMDQNFKFRETSFERYAGTFNLEYV